MENKNIETTKEYTQADLDKHVKEEHSLSTTSEYLKEIVYGGTDGIVTTFAVVAGFTGASSSNVLSLSFAAVLLFGFANLFADASSMGLGNFLSIRSDQKVFARARKKEAHEVDINPEDEKTETEFLLTKKGFSEQDAGTLTTIFAKNKDFWVDFMMHHELEMPNIENEKPGLRGLATFISFIIFGFIPLAPYLFIKEVTPAFIGAIIATFTALILLGIVRFRATKEKPFRAISEIVIIGGTSAVIAYIVGLFFRG